MFKKAKKAISIAICLMMLFTVMPSNAAINFQDVPNSHWAKAYIDEFVAKEYINGRSDTVFDPEAPVNRAEFAAIIYRIFKDMLDPPPAPTADPAAPTADPAAPTVLPAPTVAPPLTFPDVKDADWFYAAVMAAAKAKITNGFEDGSFRPTVSITRQDAATMILRTFAALEAEFKGNDAIELTDLDKVATYAKVAVETLAKNGVINGYEDKSFRPTQSITRAETVKILKVTKDRYDGIYGTPLPTTSALPTPTPAFSAVKPVMEEVVLAFPAVYNADTLAKYRVAVAGSNNVVLSTIADEAIAYGTGTVPVLMTFGKEVAGRSLPTDPITWESFVFLPYPSPIPATAPFKNELEDAKLLGKTDGKSVVTKVNMQTLTTEGTKYTYYFTDGSSQEVIFKANAGGVAIDLAGAPNTADIIVESGTKAIVSEAKLGAILVGGGSLTIENGATLVTVDGDDEEISIAPSGAIWNTGSTGVIVLEGPAAYITEGTVTAITDSAFKALGYTGTVGIKAGTGVVIEDEAKLVIPTGCTFVVNAGGILDLTSGGILEIKNGGVYWDKNIDAVNPMVGKKVDANPLADPPIVAVTPTWNANGDIEIADGIVTLKNGTIVLERNVADSIVIKGTTVLTVFDAFTPAMAQVVTVEGGATYQQENGLKRAASSGAIWNLAANSEMQFMGGSVRFTKGTTTAGFINAANRAGVAAGASATIYAEATLVIPTAFDTDKFLVAGTLTIQGGTAALAPDPAVAPATLNVLGKVNVTGTLTIQGTGTLAGKITGTGTIEGAHVYP